MGHFNMKHLDFFITCSSNVMFLYFVFYDIDVFSFVLKIELTSRKAFNSHSL